MSQHTDYVCIWRGGKERLGEERRGKEKGKRLSAYVYCMQSLTSDLSFSLTTYVFKVMASIKPSQTV